MRALVLMLGPFVVHLEADADHVGSGDAPHEVEFGAEATEALIGCVALQMEVPHPLDDETDGSAPDMAVLGCSEGCMQQFQLNDQLLVRFSGIKMPPPSAMSSAVPGEAPAAKAAEDVIEPVLETEGVVDSEVGYRGAMTDQSQGPTETAGRELDGWITVDEELGNHLCQLLTFLQGPLDLHGPTVDEESQVSKEVVDNGGKLGLIDDGRSIALVRKAEHEVGRQYAAVDDVDNDSFDAGKASVVNKGRRPVTARNGQGLVNGIGLGQWDELAKLLLMRRWDQLHCP